jgi:hypothetical protein
MGLKVCCYWLLPIVFMLSGCYNKPVRHLAADASLLIVGESTREDVLIFLGAADEQQEIGNGVEKWLYKEKDMSFFEKTPYVGKQFGSPDYQKVVVTLTNGIVTQCIYSADDEDDLDWEDDYSWQKKKK